MACFSKPIEEPAVIEKEDLSFGWRRTEVRSRAGDSLFRACIYGRVGVAKWCSILHQQCRPSIYSFLKKWKKKAMAI